MLGVCLPLTEEDAFELSVNAALGIDQDGEPDNAEADEDNNEPAAHVEVQKASAVRYLKAAEVLRHELELMVSQGHSAMEKIDTPS